MDGLTDKEETIIVDITIASCTFSLLGCLFTVVFFLAFQELRRFSYRLIFYLAIADFFWAAAFLLGPLRDKDVMCRFQSVMISYFGLCVVLWTGAIAFTLNRSVLVPAVNFQDYECKIVAGCFGLPAVVAALPLATGAYGETLGWCWISKNQDLSVSFIWELLVFYGPLWIAFGVNSYCSIAVIRVSRSFLTNEGAEGEEREERIKLFRSLRWVPLSILGCWFLASVDRLYLIVHPHSPSFTLALLHYGLGCLHGFVVAIIYLRNPLVLQTVKQSCCPYLSAPRSIELSRA